MQKKNIFIRSLEELKNPRCLAITALFIALNITMDFLNIRIQFLPTQRVSLGFLCNAAVGMLYGPAVGMVTGFCTDTLGWLLNPGGAAYFPGYTLTAMVGGLLWGLFLYPKKVTRARCFGARLAISLVCNIGLNTVWKCMTQGKAMSLILPVTITTNLILLPIQTILVYMVLDLILRQYERVFLIPAKH